MPTICDWHGRFLWSLSVQTHIAVRFYSRARPWGISAIWKTMPHKVYVAASNGPARKNYRPKDKYDFFKIKYSRMSVTKILIWEPLYKLSLIFYSLLLSQLPFSSSFGSLFHQANIRDSEVIRAQTFSVPQNVPKWRQSFPSPFLEKGPPKITEGNPFDPHWPISRISPELTWHRKMFCPAWCVTVIRSKRLCSNKTWKEFRTPNLWNPACLGNNVLRKILSFHTPPRKKSKVQGPTEHCKIRERAHQPCSQGYLLQQLQAMKGPHNRDKLWNMVKKCWK